MAHLEYFVVAETVVIDSQTNRVSIFNVLEEAAAPQFPAVIPTATAIASWNAEEGDEDRDFQAALTLNGPVGAAAGRFEVNFNFRIPLPQRRARTVIQLQGLPLTEPGEIVFTVFLNGEERAHHTVTAVIGQPPNVTARPLLQ